MNIFIKGDHAGDRNVSVPIDSAIVIYLLNYCGADNNVYVKLIKGASTNDTCSQVIMDKKSLGAFSCEFLNVSQVPEVVSNCVYPVIQDNIDCMIRSGLCSTLRHIIKGCHQVKSRLGHKDLWDLLGFRAGSLKACAEVSGWTKLCEVELPSSVSSLIHQFRHSEPTNINVPAEIMKLELHLEKPPPMHNDDKIKREALKNFRKEVTDFSKLEFSTEDEMNFVTNFFQHRTTVLPHGNMYHRIITQREKQAKLFVNVDEQTSEKCQFGCTENKLVKWCAKCNDREKLRQKEKQLEKNMARMSLTGQSNGQSPETVYCEQKAAPALSIPKPRDNQPIKDVGIQTVAELQTFLATLTLNDVVYEHVYAEGVSFTLADIVVFVCIYFLMESMQFKAGNLLKTIPFVENWLTHITTLPRMQQTSTSCGINMAAVSQCLSGDQSLAGIKELALPEVAFDLEDDSNEILRRNKGKHKALKNEIARVLQKIKTGDIDSAVGQHPRGQDVQLSWDTMPLSAHPRIELPPKRVDRKCEQLENLATAVQSIATSGDVIVDFCSGAGHLGILIAHLLPDCKVYLIENKEESLLRAKKRVDDLKLHNVTLYQCNLDYFHGPFDIGVCLHACGVATDLVLQQCLDRRAGFVICPCCYGSIQNTHLIRYPRSQYFKMADLDDKDVIVLGHAADQTEARLDIQAQGRECMYLVDTDRSARAREAGYTVTLCSLQPLSCTPKNNMLIGTLAS